MKKNKWILAIATFLIILGIVSISYEQLSYTRKEKVLNVGPFEATVEKEAHCVRLPAAYGALVILSGLCIILVELKRKS